MALLSANLGWVALSAGLAIAWGMASRVMARSRANDRLYRRANQRQSEASFVDTPPDELWGSWLERWLFISGFRGRGATVKFLVTQALAIALALAVTLPISSSGMLEIGVQWLMEIPGGVGDFMAPVLTAAPWTMFLLISLMPVSRVRSRRRDIVTQVERDLPMTLALLATLVESGLGFDAAVERVLQSLSEERPIAAELRLFRSESQTGMPRQSCFRRLARRLDIRSVTTFVSAMVHSEHVGGGISESLRRQADEVWSRRRDFAIQKAQTLPTKMAIPLVICFLPGIFVYTFGPALAQFISIAEGVVDGGQ